MNTKNIFLDVIVKNQLQLFNVIAKKCFQTQIIAEKDQQKLVNAFLEREKQASTGFENGFAIPHARTDAILAPTIFYVRLKNGIDWKSMDGLPTKYLIFLLVPEKASEKHLEMLSKIAVGLLNDEFINTLKTNTNVNEIAKAFSSLIETKDVVSSTNNSPSQKNLLAITACSVGIAHTYLAAEKLMEAAKKLNYNIKVETHGSIGVKNEFSSQEINDADLIIIASDIGIDQSRFINKKIYNAPVKRAISDGVNLIGDALNNAIVLNQGQSGAKINQTSFPNEKKSYFIKHLLSGVSYMIPFIIFGGLMLALSLGLSQIIYGKNIEGGQITGPPLYSPLWYVSQAGVVAFQLMIPILAGFIANSVAGRSAIAPAAIVAMVSNTPILIYLFPGLGDNVNPASSTPLGFLGGIFYGFLIGYTVKWMNSWNIHKNVTAVMPIFVIPLAVTSFFSLLAIFVINAPISFVMLKLGEALSSVFTNNASIALGGKIAIGIGMGALFGGMIGFDMGGPVNKIAFVTASTLLTFNPAINEPMGIVAASVAVAPLGMGISTFVYKKHFDKEQRTLGISAIVMGSIGISEGAIPFAIADPKRVIPTNVIASAIAGAIAGGLGVTGYVPHGGPIVGILGGVSGSAAIVGDNPSVLLGTGIAFFFLAIIIGTISSVLIFGLFLKVIKYSNEKPNKNAKDQANKMTFGLNLKGLPQQQKLAIIQYSMMFLAWAFLVIGIDMWIIYGPELTRIISEFKDSGQWTGGSDYLFDSPAIIYSAFTIIFGALLSLASLMHWFTYKPRNKVNTSVNA